MSLIVFYFDSGIRVAQRFFWRGISVAHRFFLFWEEDPCCSTFFVLSRGSVLLIVFLFWEGDPCCSLFFVL